MEPKIVITDDGSTTLYREDLNEHYHSTHGAIQESRHVFINAGLNYMYAKGCNRLNILEVGFGTGLNALLTLIEGQKHNINIAYIGIEPNPLKMEIINKLNYPEILHIPHLQSQFDRLYSLIDEGQVTVSDIFSLCKLTDGIEDICLIGTIDIIYFDAFSPDVQPELWTEEIFTNMYNSLRSNGCLVTYCAKGGVKRILKKVGFTVESLPGPPGKREMIRAVK